MLGIPTSQGETQTNHGVDLQCVDTCGLAVPHWEAQLLCSSGTQGWNSVCVQDPCLPLIAGWCLCQIMNSEMFPHSIFSKSLRPGINSSLNVSWNSTVKSSSLGLSGLGVWIPDSASVLIAALFRVAISFCLGLGRLHTLGISPCVQCAAACLCVRVDGGGLWSFVFLRSPV